MTQRSQALRGSWVARFGVGGAFAIVLLLSMPTVLAAAPAAPTATSNASYLSSIAAAGPKWVKVNYVSSVDKFPLSYDEVLPAGYNASHAYPVSVFLHGLMGLVNTTLKGGYLSDIVNSGWGNRTALAASKAGFILMAPNTRMVDGFYANSKYTGPQEQDILDAIAAIKTHHAISSVYLFGQSMGSIGTYSIVLHHPTLFKGLGIINDCGDVYAASYWRIVQNIPSLDVIKLITGGTFPNQSSYAQALYYYLSASRYYPQNLSGLRLYEVNGGADTLCPTSKAIWSQYQQGNNTLLTSTCNVIKAFNQPANCTKTVKALWQASPASYHWRYDYVAAGGHSPAILNAPDMYAFWLGKISGGNVCGASGAPPLACP